GAEVAELGSAEADVPANRGVGRRAVVAVAEVEGARRHEVEGAPPATREQRPLRRAAPEVDQLTRLQAAPSLVLVAGADQRTGPEPVAPRQRLTLAQADVTAARERQRHVAHRPGPAIRRRAGTARPGLRLRQAERRAAHQLAGEREVGCRLYAAMGF